MKTLPVLLIAASYGASCVDELSDVGSQSPRQQDRNDYAHHEGPDDDDEKNDQTFVGARPDLVLRLAHGNVLGLA